MEEKTRFFPDQIPKHDTFAKIETGFFPGSGNFFIGKIDEIISKSSFCIHGVIVRLENGLIGRIVHLLDSEEYEKIQLQKTEKDMFLELLLFQNLIYEQKIYDNISESLEEITQQGRAFYGEVPLSDEAKKSIREHTDSLEEKMIVTHKKMMKKVSKIRKEIEHKSDQKVEFDVEQLDGLRDKLAEFEKISRSFIMDTLSKDKNWWKQRIPEDVRKSASEKKERNEKSKTYAESLTYHLIDFTDFGDIAKIILSNKKYFNMIKDWDAFKVKIGELVKYRNDLYHSRELLKVDKYNFNVCIYHILQMFDNHVVEFVSEEMIQESRFMKYKKPIPEEHFPLASIKQKEDPKLDNDFKIIMATKIKPSLVISKNHECFLTHLSNWAKKEKIPIVQFECTSETLFSDFAGRRDYTTNSKDGVIGVELGAMKLANELSDIHGYAILILENIGNLGSYFQDGFIRPFLDWGELPSGQTKEMITMKNHKKLKIIGTQIQLKKGEEYLLSPRLSEFFGYYNL